MNKKSKKYVAYALLVTSTLINSSNSFAQKSESNHWGFSHMEKLLENKIFKGYTDGSLKPEKNMTRAEFISMVNNMYGFRNKSNVDFTDLVNDTWYKSQVEIGKDKDYIDLITQDNFFGDKAITREEASAILGFLFNSKSLDESLNFKDSSSINPEYIQYISGLTSTGSIDGYENGNFNPKGSITRAEVASIINKSISKVYNKPGIYKDNIVGNVIINTDGVILENANIQGNLYIGGDLNSNSIEIKNSKIWGDVQVFSNNPKVVTLDNTNIGKISLFYNNTVSKKTVDTLVTSSSSSDRKSKSTNSRSSYNKNTNSNKPSEKIDSESKVEEKPTIDTPKTTNFINKTNTKVMDIEGVLYLVLSLNEGTIADYSYSINNKEITMSKVNTRGTILKFELSNRESFTLTLHKDKTSQSLEINL